ncbi:putative exonuclease V, mitochondrial [Mycena sanguinolenta]|uniref:Putative exonuclease V, mitochondrial n=1 Tax=Mycena sanguinolenta TaxID=230812 RepID=A0A8H6Z586_9AGAR|nr:putative exonuclease V, mitochondrial [Mycena sanguinolenta]
MSDDSEYEAYNDYSSLTEEEFARLDRSDAAVPLLTSPPISNDVHEASSYVDPAMPSIPTALEDEASHPTINARIGPIQRYRPYGILAVTDLSGLIWCGVKYDYDLRPKRVQRPGKENRPVASSQEVSVQQGVAAKNYEATQIGQEIHNDLALEVEPEQIEVVCRTQEERWAFRLLKCFSSLVSLKATGCAREIPVFGIVDGTVIVGRIDELIIADASEPQTARKRAHAQLSCEPKAIIARSAPSQCIHLIETKTVTHQRNSVPSDEDTKPAQFQAMIYHRLLARLLDPSASFDFTALWMKLGVRPSAPFSSEFVQQVAHVRDAPNSLPLCLEDVLDLPRLDNTLRLVYRSQKGYKCSGYGPEGNGREDMTYDVPPTLREDNEVSAAIEVTKVIEGRLADALRKPTFINGPPLTAKKGDHQTAKVIEIKRFTMDDAMLNDFLPHALDWWRGNKAATGVSEAQTNRCNSCEYRAHCWWRKQKAQEWAKAKGLAWADDF